MFLHVVNFHVALFFILPIHHVIKRLADPVKTQDLLDLSNLHLGVKRLVLRNNAYEVGQGEDG